MAIDVSVVVAGAQVEPSTWSTVALLLLLILGIGVITHTLVQLLVFYLLFAIPAAALMALNRVADLAIDVIAYHVPSYSAYAVVPHMHWLVLSVNAKQAALYSGDIYFTLTSKDKQQVVIEFMQKLYPLELNIKEWS